MSKQTDMAGDDLSTLVDSCFRIKLQVSPALLPQLKDGATELLKTAKMGDLKPLEMIIQASQDKSKTIKPTLTFEDGGKGMIGVVILQVEVHK
jgi:hypothetical protein